MITRQSKKQGREIGAVQNDPPEEKSNFAAPGRRGGKKSKKQPIN
jgi:hypothetical protein